MTQSVKGSGINTRIEMAEGTDETFQQTLVDSAGTAVDVTGASGSFYLRDHPDGLGSVNVTKAVSVVDGPNGIVEWTVAASDTSGLVNQCAQKEFFHATMVTLASGAVKQVSYGTFVLRPTGL